MTMSDLSKQLKTGKFNEISLEYERKVKNGFSNNYKTNLFFFSKIYIIYYVGRYPRPGCIISNRRNVAVCVKRDFPV